MLTQDPALLWQAVLDQLLLWGAIFAAVYVYFAWAIMRLAQQTGTPGAWRAWVPVLNLILVARIGRRSAAWVLACFIPLLGLLPLAWLWMGAAKARGKASALGLLILVPLVNLLLPLLLMAGGRATAAPAAVSGGSLSLRDAAPERCASCGALREGADLFCGDCGTAFLPLQAQTPVPSAPVVTTTASRSSLVPVLFVIALVAVGGYFGYQQWVASSTSGDGAVVPVVPARVAGVLREFPVDTAPTPAVPTSVITQDLRASGAVDLPPDWLPPGVTAQTLSRSATSVTAARYREGTSGPRADVHVLQVPGSPSAAARAVADAVEDGARASVSRTTLALDAPTGATYAGWKLAGPAGQTVVLGRDNGPVVIVIYGATAMAGPLVDRLAAHVGNGNGLLEAPGVAGALAQLPAAPPSGFTLQDVATFARQDLLDGALQSNALDQLGLQTSGVLSAVGQVLPEALTLARYTDASGQPWQMGVGDYGGQIRLTAVWTLLRGLLSAAGVISGDVEEGAVIQHEDGTYVLRKEGTRLRLVRGRRGAPTGPLLALAGAAMSGAAPGQGAPAAAAAPTTVPPTALGVPMPPPPTETQQPERPAPITETSRTPEVTRESTPPASSSSVSPFRGSWVGTQVLRQGLGRETPGQQVQLGLALYSDPDGRWLVREQAELHVWLFAQWYTPQISVTGNTMTIRYLYSDRGELTPQTNEEQITLELRGDAILGERRNIVRYMGPTATPDMVGTRTYDIRLTRRR